jgi:pimeloyl-ACP methyl ester carboxylesterase
MPTSFVTMEDGERYFRNVLEPYGYLSDEHWRHIASHSLCWDDERRHYAVLCDPAIAKSFNSPWFYPLDLWKYWEAIKVPLLVLHGARSDLLSSGMAQEMRKRNPRASVFRFDDCGHVPPLMTGDQIEVVTTFLETRST